MINPERHRLRFGNFGEVWCSCGWEYNPFFFGRPGRAARLANEHLRAVWRDEP